MRKRSKSRRSGRKARGGVKKAVTMVLDRNYLLKNIPKALKKKLSVTLKKNKFSGTGLFATK
ncbi:MAG: hypothetical protein GY774_08825, partial [Planctomycetes bacterium]|nr:hypothetical protein [Planctomycetota bacterium]